MTGILWGEKKIHDKSAEQPNLLDSTLKMAAYGYNHDGICHIKSSIKLCKGGGLQIFWRYGRANILTANDNSVHNKSANWAATTQDVNKAHL
jgi:hypothetical protein